MNKPMLLLRNLPVVFITAFLFFSSNEVYAKKNNILNTAEPDGNNSVNGGFGLQLGLSDWAPGGFKWFNEYNRGISEHVWLNIQVNLSLGNSRYRCWYDDRGRRHCDDRYYDYRWGGNALEFAVGPKLRFPLDKIPLIIDAKLGGMLDLLFFGGGYSGISAGFRGGVGVHYFIFDNLGIGAEIMCNMGPYIINGYTGFFATLDFQILGVEFRF